MGCQWVFKHKRDGTFRSRLVGKGYTQVPGIDFTDSFAPVIHDISLRTLLVIYLQHDDWEMTGFDVETAFLYGKLDEPLYMKLPDGFLNYSDQRKQFEGYQQKDLVLKLHKTIYGVVQAARAFNSSFNTVLETKLKFVRSKADPCVYMRKDTNGTVMLLLYVDDGLCIGNKQAIKHATRDLQLHFDITEDEGHGYTGSTFIPTSKGIIIHQSTLIKALMKSRPKPTGKRFLTPAPPGSILHKDTGTLLSAKEMKAYRSDTGKALYFVKISRPDIANATRELSKFMDRATDEHLLHLSRLMDYILTTHKKGLLIKKSAPGPLKIIAYCDSNWASDKDTRRSITGSLIFVNDSLVAWKSKMQDSVSLSSSEAEYIAMSMCLMEMMFIYHLCESLQLVIELPMIIYCDNTGAISLCDNYSTTGRTRHIDIRWHYIRDKQAEGKVVIAHVHTKYNLADPLTKNVSTGCFQQHAPHLVTDIPED